MKVLLTTLNSKYVHSNLALKYLYCVAADSDLDLHLQEFTINNDMTYVYTEMVRGGFDVVCFSCYIWNIEKIVQLGAELKKACPELKILLGGPEVSYEAEDFLTQNAWADYIIKGEGERPFFQFCKELVLNRKEFNRVEGLVYRNHGQICSNPIGQLLPMDRVPFPYERLEIEQDKVIYYESARGCPFQCSYCLSSLETSMRMLSLERTFRDLRYFLFHEVKQVKFIDRTFNINGDRAFEIWQYLIHNDNGKTNFHFEICGELIEDRHLQLLSKARKGLFQLEIGIQSTNANTLKAVDRSEHIQKTLERVEKLVELGNMHIHVDLIAGLPEEGYKSFAASFNQVYALGADNLQLGFLKLLKGTKIRKQAETYGYVYRDEAPYELIANHHMSAIDLVKLKMIEHVLDLYDNKGGFSKTIAFLMPIVGNSPFHFYEQLADYFYGNGYQHRSHKKEDLYRIFMGFLLDKKRLDDETVNQGKALLAEDIADTMNVDVVKRFHKKGWEI
ncbi:radical SAM superfamily enzyme YgiQ (UPF0313 family) [Clostridiales Family XIII bacterium PM5-7]